MVDIIRRRFDESTKPLYPLAQHLAQYMRQRGAALARNSSPIQIGKTVFPHVLDMKRCDREGWR